MHSSNFTPIDDIEGLKSKLGMQTMKATLYGLLWRIKLSHLWLLLILQNYDAIYHQYCCKTELSSDSQVFWSLSWLISGLAIFTPNSARLSTSRIMGNSQVKQQVHRERSVFSVSVLCLFRVFHVLSDQCLANLRQFWNKFHEHWETSWYWGWRLKKFRGQFARSFITIKL